MESISDVDRDALPIVDKISDIAIIIINLTETEGSWNDSDWSNSSLEDSSVFRWAELVFKGTLLTLIIFLTIFGNLLVLLAVTFTTNLRTTTNCFIVNLALADLLLGISVLPFSATLELNEKQWLFGQMFCNIWAATDVLCCTASILSLCVISVDRYIGVTRPLAYSNIVTHTRATIACILVWILSVAISLGPLLGWKEPPPENPYVCEVTKQTGYVLFSVTFSFYLPSTIIFVVYFRIYKAAVRQTKFLETGVKVVKSGNHETTKELTLRVHAGVQQMVNATSRNGAYTGDKSDKNSSVKLTVAALHGRLVKFRRQKKAAKTLGIVVGVFIMCWLPFFFLLPLRTLCAWCYINDIIFDIFFWTGYFNSCLNPIIYACSSRDFKRAFRQVLQCTGLSTTHDMRSFRGRTINFTLRSTRRSVDKKTTSPTAADPVSEETKKVPIGARSYSQESSQSPVSLGGGGKVPEEPPPYSSNIQSPVAEAILRCSGVRNGSGTDTDCTVVGSSE